MSRKKRSKARRQWGCKSPAGCGFMFDGRQVLDGLAAEATAARARGLTAGGPTTIVCPGCNTFHFLTDDRAGVRLLTPAERFQLHVDVPDAATRAETHRVAPGHPELHLCRVEG